MVGVGRTAEFVQAELGTEFDGSRTNPIVERNTGGVGDPHQAIENSHGRGGLHKGFGADRLDQGLTGSGEFGAAASGSLGELAELISVGDSTAAFTDRAVQIRLLPDGFATRTEQRYMGSRSVETLVK